MIKALVIGEQASGKTSLCQTLPSFASKKGVKTLAINLAYLCKHITFTPAIDVRKEVKLSKSEAADEEKAFAKIAGNKKFWSKISSLDADLILLDSDISLERALLFGNPVLEKIDLILCVFNPKEALKEWVVKVHCRSLSEVNEKKVLCVINEKQLFAKKRQPKLDSAFLEKNEWGEKTADSTGIELIRVSAIEKNGFGKLLEKITSE